MFQPIRLMHIREISNNLEHLVSKGIKRKQLTVKGYGETKPVAPNLLPNGKDNFEGRKKNRRTEMKIIG